MAPNVLEEIVKNIYRRKLEELLDENGFSD